MTPDWLRAAAVRLAEAGIADALREARWIAARALGTDAAGVLAVDLAEPAGFAGLVARRAAREPLAYILGDAPFMDITLGVCRATLIPRADSETVVAAALAARTPDEVGRVLDLGTGTGCLLLTVLLALPSAFGVGVDRAPAACDLARANAARLGLQSRAAFVCANWAAPMRGQFDLVLSNPPYIPSADLSTLMPEVTQYEPRLALDGGRDGLAAYRVLLATLPRLLTENGLAVLELGAGQADVVSRLARDKGFTIAFRRDQGGHDRAMLLWRDGTKPAETSARKKSFGSARSDV